LTVVTHPASATSLPCDTYTDVALGKTATASSVNLSQSAAKAVDGNNTSKWGSLASDPQWLQVDLGSTQAICSVTLLWANYATAFSLQVSDDATNWTTLISTGATKNGSQSLPVSGSGRYLRMYGTARGDTSTGYGIRELDVYSPANPLPPVFTSPATATFSLSVHGNFSVSTRGVPAVTSIPESGFLPIGLRFTDNGDGTASIAGTPTGAAGDYHVTLTATNGVAPDATQTLTIQINSTQLTVTTTADIAANAGDCGNTSTTVPSPLSLREATCIANNYGNSQPVTINIPAGHYTLTNGELQPGKVTGSNISIVGAGSASTIIDGNHASRVLDIDGPIVGGVITSISGVTITNGADSTFGGAGIIAGSGTQSTTDSLTVSNTVISNNVADAATPTATNKPGGGLAMEGGVLTLTNVTVTGNSSHSSAGSGVYYQAFGTATPQSMSITGSTFSGNSVVTSNTVGQNGGALAVVGAGLATAYTVSNSSFTGNTVSSTSGELAAGAAIYQEHGTLTITGSTFTSNIVSGTSVLGGSVLFTDNGSAALHYDRIVGNDSTHAAVMAGTAGTVNATEDWWGCNAGPGSTGCDGTSGTGITSAPWLVLTAAASPSQVTGPGGTATITASLTTDSAGNPVNGTNLTGAFDSLPVSFADPPGDATVGGSPGAHSVNLSGGTASIDYHSNTTLGPDPDPVTLDDATVPAVLEVDAPPAITSAASATFTVGSAGSFTVTTTGYPAAAITESGGLPAGVSFTDNGDGTATIAGTPYTGSGWMYNLLIAASDGSGPDAGQSFTLTVVEPPRITSADQATFRAASASSFTVFTSTGYPVATTLAESGTLPSGVTFTDNGDGTATVAGTPDAGTGGSYPLTITAGNGIAPDATQTFTLTVLEPPRITSAVQATFTAGSPGSFTVTTSAGYPVATTLAESGTLPSGVTFTDNGDGTATIAGTPASSGSYPVQLRASNGVSPNPVQSFTLTVSPPPPLIAFTGFRSRW
jgi:hypothetical protein